MARIHLCFLWHMHQPLYKNLATGEYRLPWTRMHALKDYYGMVKILDEFPTLHQTFNLVPSLLLQIQDYASGNARDPFLECAVTPAEDLSEGQRVFLLRYFFQANPSRLIYRYPRYGELFDRRHGAFSTQEIRDLQVLSQLAWFDEEFQANDREVRKLLGKERNYSLEEQALMARKQREIISSVIPVYKEFAARGQIELSTTPFYHPILPLLCDSNIAAESHPGRTLPAQFRYPLDAGRQLRTARDFMQREFGRAPVGLWPSEGSVSDDALALAAETGFEWAASDNGVLARTLNVTAAPDSTYQSYLWRGQLRMIFRDHYLSDLIGFSYSDLAADEAAGHFIDRIRESASTIAKTTPVLVPIILDGENAWEYYYLNGRPFLRELYRRIAESPDMACLTVTEALRQEEPRPIGRIFPGSWIDANFDVWIGAGEDNRAWELLLKARRTYDESGSRVSEDRRRVAYEELLIAEGSDWCWWYGPEHQSENRLEFDELYREHLTNMYLALDMTPPDELAQPILETNLASSHALPTGRIRPTIDGEVTSYFEWMGAGHYRPDSRPGSMHGHRVPVRELHYGRDEANLYVRLDLDRTTEKIALRASHSLLPLLGNPNIESAQGKILEARIPLDLLGAAPVRFQIQIDNDMLPPDGWIDLEI